jgi:biotin carboxylase
MKIKRKSEMKKIFQKAGVRVARGRVCLNEEETREFIREVGYPVVAKPDIGVGAAKTYKIMDDWELRHYLSDKLPVDYILEEFIAGQIVTYDGMTDRDGRLVFVASHEYSKGVMETVNEDSDIYYYGVREIPGDLDKVGKAVLKAFNVRERFFHLEFFRLPDNQIVALEVNMRPPGGLTTDMFNFANDIDVYKMWAEILVRGHTDAQATRPYFCAYVGRKNSISYALSHDQVMQHFHGMIVNASQIDGVFSRAIGNYGYIIRHPELEAIVQTANEIHRRA